MKTPSSGPTRHGEPNSEGDGPRAGWPRGAEPRAPATERHGVGEDAVSTWRQVDAALTPILGGPGVGALFQRSLYLAREQSPWLAEVETSALQLGDFAALESLLERHGEDDARAAQQALFDAFSATLTSLIGSDLAARLLRPVLAQAIGQAMDRRDVSMSEQACSEQESERDERHGEQ